MIKDIEILHNNETYIATVEVEIETEESYCTSEFWGTPVREEIKEEYIKELTVLNLDRYDEGLDEWVETTPDKYITSEIRILAEQYFLSN